MNLPDKLPTKKSFLTRIMEGNFFPANKNTLRALLNQERKTIRELNGEIESLKATVATVREENENLHDLLCTTDGGELHKIVQEGKPHLYLVVYKTTFTGEWLIQLRHPEIFKLEIAKARIALQDNDGILLKGIRVNQFYQRKGYGKIFLLELIILMSKSGKHWLPSLLPINTSAELEVAKKLFTKFNFLVTTEGRFLYITPPDFTELALVPNT